MRKITAYVKGDRSTPEYYRVYQYLDHIDDVRVTYRLMFSPAAYDRFMPVSRQPLPVKVYMYLMSYLRMLLALCCDCLRRPDCIVIHKRIISHFMPLSYRCMLRILARRGTRIYWDIDDNILSTGEVSQSAFDMMCSLSSKIVVTHEYLASFVRQPYQDKVALLPTTDGDLLPYFEDAAVRARRLDALRKEVCLIWLGTSGNLTFVEDVIPQLEEAARQLRQRDNRRLRLKVVCNEPLQTSAEWLQVENVRWSHDGAIRELLQSHIGLMPLRENAFTQGKGGFKLVQYLASGLPGIGSDVGFNRQIIDSRCGCLIDGGHPEGWVAAILELSDPDVWAGKSRGAYRKWEQKFSYADNLAFWEGMLRAEKAQGRK